YPQGMEQGARYIECLPMDEDSKCSNSLNLTAANMETYIMDHRNYFDVLVPNFGQSGCTA
ncbi:hypothetical protein PMAYCL1PPCAC_08598, partial [Pristionchus mayeri]